MVSLSEYEPKTNREVVSLIDSLGQLNHPLPKLLKRFCLAESSYYYIKNTPKVQHETSVVDAILALQTKAKGRLWCRSMKDRLLLEYNSIVSINRVIKIMRGLHIQPIPLKKLRYSSYYGNVGKVFDNLLLETITIEDGTTKKVRDFKVEKVFDVLVGDVSEVTTKDGKEVYIGMFRDLKSGLMVAADCALHPNMDQQIRLLNQVKEIVGFNPRTKIHTDQGHLYQLPRFTEFVTKMGWIQSMSRKGNCLDNCFAETWFSRFKNDIYFGFEYENFEEFQIAFYAYIEYYNYVRTCNKTHMTPYKYFISHLPVGEKKSEEDNEDDSEA